MAPAGAADARGRTLRRGPHGRGRYPLAQRRPRSASGLPTGVGRLTPGCRQRSSHCPDSSLYRRHRPRTFAEVVGQEQVVRTLRNAVERDRVHHAYLFVGSRGTGKTSMAKILAACLNCARGPDGRRPAGVCESCVSIARASSLDVIEMDAASYNSVDDIRALRECVAYAPVCGRRKIYILDEAHMLSTAAWNAFLKTLEEPPPNTVFVLATTEAQKVLPTVVDRCHRFDFQRPDGRADRDRAAPRRRRRGDPDPPGGGRRARPLGHRQLPRRARHARAAGHLQRRRDRARGRTGGARRRRRRLPSARSTPSPVATRAARCGRSRSASQRPRPGRVHPRARGRVPRAADRPGARRGPVRAVA